MNLSENNYMIQCMKEIKGNKVIYISSDNRAIILDLNSKKLDNELFKDK